MLVFARLFFRSVLDILLANRVLIVSIFGIKTALAGLSMYLGAKLAGIHITTRHIFVISVVLFSVSTVLVTKAAVARMQEEQPKRRRKSVA